MSLPHTPNTTCDIYRNASSPPATPNAEAVRIFLTGAYDQGLESEEETVVGTSKAFSHIMLCESSVDVRDGYAYGTITAASRDKVYIPDQNGTLFYVQFVEMVSTDQSTEHKRVYLVRQSPNWPTDDV